RTGLKAYQIFWTTYEAWLQKQIPRAMNRVRDDSTKRVFAIVLKLTLVPRRLTTHEVDCSSSNGHGPKKQNERQIRGGLRQLRLAFSAIARCRTLCRRGRWSCGCRLCRNF